MSTYFFPSDLTKKIGFSGLLFGDENAVVCLSRLSLFITFLFSSLGFFAICYKLMQLRAVKLVVD